MRNFDSSAGYLGIVERMTETKSTGVTPRAHVEELQAKFDRQNLIIQTLLMILLEKKVIMEDEFKEWMAYVDGLDGVRDGKLTPEVAPRTCAKCQRNNPKMATRCIYCGQEFELDFLTRRPAKE